MFFKNYKINIFDIKNKNKKQKAYNKIYLL